MPPPAGAQTHPGAAPDDALASALHWPAANQWLRVDAVVLGGTGHMRCLPPAVRVVQLQQDAAPPPPGSAAAAAAAVERLALEAEAAEAEDEEEAAALRARAADVAAAAAAAASGEAAAPRATGSFLLAPPPPTLASPHAVQSARVRFEIVADRLALSGAAEISAYMHAETGELVVADVSATPDLSPGSLAYRAAAADAEAPLSSAELLHELVRVGLMERPDDAGRGADDMAVMAPYPEAGEVRCGAGWCCLCRGVGWSPSCHSALAGRAPGWGGLAPQRARPSPSPSPSPWLWHPLTPAPPLPAYPCRTRLPTTTPRRASSAPGRTRALPTRSPHWGSGAAAPSSQPDARRRLHPPAQLAGQCRRRGRHTPFLPQFLSFTPFALSTLPPSLTRLTSVPR